MSALSRLRGQPQDSEYIQVEIAEIIANDEYEREMIPSTGWFGGWANCFKGGLWTQKSNLRRTILGTSLQMMQQWYVFSRRVSCSFPSQRPLIYLFQDWCQLHLLLLHSLPAIDRRHQQHLLDLPDLHPRQCVLDSDFILHR